MSPKVLCTVRLLVDNEPRLCAASLGLASRITVTIAASDDAHGVFQFGPGSLSVEGTEPEDGRSAVVLQVGVRPSQSGGSRPCTSDAALSQVERTFGDLSGVIVFWEAEPRSEGELLSRAGNITMGVGQRSGSLTINVAQDQVPELDQSFAVSLVNVSHGRLGARTAATLTVLASDHPYGVFVFANESRHVRLPEADATVSLTISRQKGLMGRVCA